MKRRPVKKRRRVAMPRVRGAKGVKIGLYLPAEVMAEVRAVAAKHDRTMSWVVVLAVKRMLARLREGAAS